MCHVTQKSKPHRSASQFCSKPFPIFLPFHFLCPPLLPYNLYLALFYSFISQLHETFISRLCFDPYSTPESIKLASCSQDGVISVIDVSTGTQVFVVQERTQGGPDSLTYISWIADNGNDGMNEYDGNDDNRNDKTATLLANASVSPSSSLPGRLAGLYCGKESGELDVWDMVQGKRREKLINEASPVSCLDVKTGVGITAGYQHGTVLLWLLKT